MVNFTVLSFYVHQGIHIGGTFKMSESLLMLTCDLLCELLAF